jgi:hypothetical protein
MVDRAKPGDCSGDQQGDKKGSESGNTDLCNEVPRGETRLSNPSRRTLVADAGVPVAQQQPDIPANILENTLEGARRYNQTVGGLVEDKLKQHPDATTGSVKSDHGEPATALDKELNGLTNKQLAERLHTDVNDDKQRQKFEDQFKDERLKAMIMSTLYGELNKPESGAESNKLAAQIKADFNDPQKRDAIMQNFEGEFLNKYSAMLGDKSKPNYSEANSKLMQDLKSDWLDPGKKAHLEEGILWPGKARNCCCASERDKAVGMISWIEKGAKAQNAACHGNYLEQYFPPKTIEFKKA